MDYHGGFKARFLAAAHVVIKECRGLSITVSACGRPKMRGVVAVESVWGSRSQEEHQSDHLQLRF